MILISSHSNPKIKQVRLLRKRKHRQESGLFVVEGIHHVGQLVEAAVISQTGFSVESIFYASDLLTSEFAKELIEKQSQKGTPCHATTPEVFASLARKENPQGILALARSPQRKLSDLSPENFTWGVALVEPQDPGNIGTILRTIDAVGASGMLLLDSSADLYHPGAIRASMGAVFWYPTVQATFPGFTAWARGHGYHIYGTSTHASVDYREFKHYERPAVLLLGSEREGLSAVQSASCDVLLRLPMYGRVSSLNLAVAAGVMLYKLKEYV